MTSQRTNIPSFGIRGGKQTSAHLAVEEAPSKTVSIDNVKDATPGSLTLNSRDGKLYYHNGQGWAPLGVDLGLIRAGQDQRVHFTAPPQWGMTIKAGDNSRDRGGDLKLSSGLGGVSDGEIYLDIGGETALKIRKNGEIVCNGTILLESGIKQHVTRASTDGEEVELNGYLGVLTVNYEIKEDEILSGTIKNDLLTKDSHVTISAHAETGVPLVWVSEQTGGSIKYNIKSMNDTLNSVQLHFTVHNSL